MRMMINDMSVVSNYFATDWLLKFYVTIIGNYRPSETCQDSQLKPCYHQTLWILLKISHRDILAFDHQICYSEPKLFIDLPIDKPYCTMDANWKMWWIIQSTRIKIMYYVL